MSARKFKGKPCVYCGGARPAVTGDHIFARQFFPLSKRSNLPQAPTCYTCNNSKSHLERYLTAILPFGSRHREAGNDLKTMVPRRLHGDRKLHRQLQQRLELAWVRSLGGVLLPAMTIPFESARLDQWVGYIVKGLIWHHWQIVLPVDHVIMTACLNRPGVGLFERLFAMNARNRVYGNLGDGRFIYRAAQGTDDVTVWQFQLFNGVALAGDPEKPDEVSALVGVVTGSKRLGNLFTALGARRTNPAA